MFLCHLSVCPSLCPCMHVLVRPLCCFCIIYGWFALMDFHQTFVAGASWDKDEPIRFWGQKVKGQGPCPDLLKLTTGQAGEGISAQYCGIKFWSSSHILRKKVSKYKERLKYNTCRCSFCKEHCIRLRRDVILQVAGP